MKRTSLITIVATCAIGPVAAQTVIKYDFETKMPAKINWVELGQNAIFKIENINKFLYEVKIESQQVEYKSEPPALFAEVLGIEKTKESEVKKVVEKIQTDTEPGVAGYAKGVASLLQDQMMLEIKGDELANMEVLPDSLQEGVKIARLEQEIDDLKREIIEQQKALTALKEVIDDEYSKVVQELQSKSLMVHTSYNLLELAKNVKNDLVLIAMSDGLTYKESLERTEVVFLKNEFINNSSKLLSSFNKSYQDFQSAYDLYLIDAKVREKFNNDEQKIRNSVASLYSAVEFLKVSVDDYDYSQLFQNINILISELGNENNFFVVSDPVQAEKDELKFEIEITPRASVQSSSARDRRKFTTSVPVKGGVKIDFSTGLFMKAGLSNRKYTVTPLASDTTRSIIKPNKNNDLVHVSLGALMHVSPRTLQNFKPGFTFGFGLNSTEITEADIFVGASGMFGSQEQFIVSTGVSFASVDYLKGRYELDTETPNTDIENDLTEKTVRAGWFISFTYNLTNKKKE